jgi:hypothetical protein
VHPDPFQIVLKNVDLDRPVAGVPQAPAVFAIGFVP